MKNNKNKNQIDRNDLINQLRTLGIHPGWLSGFIDSDGSFAVNISENSRGKITVSLTFNLTQHINNLALFKLFKTFFKSGHVGLNRDRLVRFNLSSLKVLESHLFPLLEEYPLLTQKRHDFEDFKRVHSMMKNKEHLTEQGLNKIRKIKAGMNRGRSKFE